MIRRFLLWLTARLPVREIAHNGTVFLERYNVGVLGDWRFYIHRFIASDPDGVHDHPWRWGVSIILSGWYMEARRDGMRVRRWGNMVNGDTFHRVMISPGGEAWTLFAHTRRVKPWGMLRPAQHPGYYGAREDGTGEARITHVCVEQNGADPEHSTWHLSAPKGRDIRRST